MSTLSPSCVELPAGLQLYVHTCVMLSPALTVAGFIPANADQWMGWVPFCLAFLAVSIAILVPLWRLGWVWAPSSADAYGLMGVMGVILMLWDALKCHAQTWHYVVIALVWAKVNPNGTLAGVVAVSSVAALLTVMTVLLILWGLGRIGGAGL